MQSPAASQPDTIQLQLNFTTSNGHADPISDKEFLSMQPSVSCCYTSLRDILPASPPAMTSPPLHNSSWQEIPIKNHLVKQAALAYLQPACSLPEVGRKDLFGRLKNAVEECGCLSWLNDVVVKSFRDLFSQQTTATRSDELCDYNCDYGYDYEEEDNQKL